jgi:hypothetical protein
MAGLVGLKIGCNLAASDTLRRLFSTISPLLDEPDVDPVTRYEVNMIYHSVLGDVETALQAMNQFLGVARAERNPLTLSRALGNAGLASRLAGRPAEAVALFSEARDCSAKNGLHNRAAMAAYSLVRLYLASGNIQEARHAMDQAETLARPDEDVHFIADRPYLVARMAMEEGDLSQASILMERIRQTTTSTQSVNRRASVLALGIQIGIRKGDRRDDILELVAELETVHAMNRTTGWQDFEAYSLFLGLCALGEGARGKQLLSDYATIYRREKWALPASLSQALS